MKIKLRTLSPVHIGSGEEITPMEYVVNEKFTRINMNGLFNDPDFEPMMDKFIDAAGSQRYIGQLLPHDVLKKHPLYSLKIRGEAKSYLKTNQTVIKAHIKSGDRVYIPGSSLKGSLLSAMIWQVLRDPPAEFRQQIEDYLLSPKDYNKLLDLAIAFLVYEKPFKPEGKRFLHWLDVSDSNLKSPEALEICLAKVEGAKGERLPILYETIQIGQEFELRMTAQRTRFSVSKMLKFADQFYRKVLLKDGTTGIHSNSFLMRLGQGSSAFATSLLILADDLGISDYQIKPPATRKRIDENFAMGWIELIELPDEKQSS